MDRREFIFRRLPTLLLAPSVLLTIVDRAEARITTIANFLAPFGSEYHENTEWDFGSGPLLTGVNGHNGNLLVLVDGVWISSSVKQTMFDPAHQCLQVRLNSITGPVVFGYNPLASRIARDRS